MPIPDYQSCMLPLLEFAADSNEHSTRDAIEALAIHFGLTDVQRHELLPSGTQPVFDNRVGWARTYMKKAGLIEYPKRAQFKITPRGIEVLLRKPKRINVKFLEQFPEFQEFKALSRASQNGGAIDAEPKESQTPEELIETAYGQIQSALASELLAKVKAASPGFFERLVVDLLVKMGYGGSRADAGRAIGKSGDGGIDGIINEDRLGLDVIYIQAKRWSDTKIGSPEVSKFVGAVTKRHAQKGVFITTSTFTKEAEEFVSGIGLKIVLIDGPTLAELMIEYGIGVTPQAVYEVKRMDSDYFTEE
jgi:restriction system protein